MVQEVIVSKLLKFFLENKKQFVFTHGFNSKLLNLSCGLFQGFYLANDFFQFTLMTFLTPSQVFLAYLLTTLLIIFLSKTTINCKKIQ